MAKAKELTDRNSKDINALYKKFLVKNPNVNANDFIERNKKSLLTFISNLPIQQSRKKDYFFAVARYLETKGQRYFKTYQQAGYDLYLTINDEAKQGVQTEKQKEFYMSHDEMRNIIETKSWTQTNVESHNQYLLLNILTLQPPLRPAFYISCKFITQLKQNNKKDNYLLINNRTKKMYYIVNDDKISKARFHQDKIEIENKELKKIILESYKNFPRTYLFEKDGQPISYDSILNMLRKGLNNEKIGFSMVRSSYVNYFYLTNLDLKSREKLASEMRHTYTTAVTHYQKPVLSDAKCETELQKLKDENAKLKNNLELCEPVEKPEINLTARRNTLLKINRDSMTPRLSTINKYNLILDKHGVWV